MFSREISDVNSIILPDNEAPTITSTMLETIIDDPDVLEGKNDEWLESTLTDMEFDGLEYIAGYIAFKLRHKEDLRAPTSEHFGSHFSWTNHLSEGGLYKSYDEFLQQIKWLEQIFIKHNGVEGLEVGEKYICSLVELTSNISVKVKIYT